MLLWALFQEFSILYLAYQLQNIAVHQHRGGPMANVSNEAYTHESGASSNLPYPMQHTPGN